VSTGEGEFAEAGVEAEDVPVGDAELAGLVLVVVGLARTVGLGVVVGGDVEGEGDEDGVVAAGTPTVAAGGGLTSR